MPSKTSDARVRESFAPHGSLLACQDRLPLLALFSVRSIQNPTTPIKKPGGVPEAPREIASAVSRVVDLDRLPCSDRTTIAKPPQVVE